jgi:hypothetical protein
LDVGRQSGDAFVDTQQLLQLAELYKLADKLNAVGGIERILILDLRHQQIQKCTLASERTGKASN